MLAFQLDGKTYNLPESWNEVTLQQAVDAMKIADKMPQKLYEATFSENPPKTTEQDTIEFAEFYKHWFSYWTKVPVEIVGRMNLKDKGEELGLISMYKIYLSNFLFTPSGFTPTNSFKLKGVEYALPISEADLRTKPMPEGSFDEFIEALMVKRVIDESKTYDFTKLPRITAMLFRPVYEKVEPASWERRGFRIIRHKKKVHRLIEMYDSNTVLAREALFMNELTMDKAWSAYFFLLGLNNSFTRLFKTQSSRLQKVEKSLIK